MLSFMSFTPSKNFVCKLQEMWCSLVLMLNQHGTAFWP